jgi:hypothetical protein
VGGGVNVDDIRDDVNVDDVNVRDIEYDVNVEDVGDVGDVVDV